MYTKNLAMLGPLRMSRPIFCIEIACSLLFKCSVPAGLAEWKGADFTRHFFLPYRVQAGHIHCLGVDAAAVACRADSAGSDGAGP